MIQHKQAIVKERIEKIIFIVYSYCCQPVMTDCQAEAVGGKKRILPADKGGGLPLKGNLCGCGSIRCSCRRVWSTTISGTLSYYLQNFDRLLNRTETEIDETPFIRHMQHGESGSGIISAEVSYFSLKVFPQRQFQCFLLHDCADGRLIPAPYRSMNMGSQDNCIPCRRQVQKLCFRGTPVFVEPYTIQAAFATRLPEERTGPSEKRHAVSSAISFKMLR